MKQLLYILSFIVTFSSCITRQKCNDKYPPQIEVKDSIVIKDTVIYRDTIITIPGDQLTVTEFIHDTLVFVDTVIIGKNTQLHLTVAKGKIKATCTADSLQLVINNLQKIISSKQQFKTVTTTVTVPVKKPYIPMWLIVALIVSIGWNFRKLLTITIKQLLQ